MLGIERFPEVLVHSDGKAIKTVLVGSVRGYGENRNRRKNGVFANKTSRLDAVHLGHLYVHED